MNRSIGAHSIRVSRIHRLNLDTLGFPVSLQGTAAVATSAFPYFSQAQEGDLTWGGAPRSRIKLDVLA